MQAHNDVDDRAQAGPSALEARVAELETANRTLVTRNTMLAGELQRSSDALEEAAEILIAEDLRDAALMLQRAADHAAKVAKPAEAA